MSLYDVGMRAAKRFRTLSNYRASLDSLQRGRCLGLSKDLDAALLAEEKVRAYQEKCNHWPCFDCNGEKATTKYCPDCGKRLEG